MIEIVLDSFFQEAPELIEKLENAVTKKDIEEYNALIKAANHD